MKDKLFITILVLLLGSSTFAQEKMLNVFLEKNLEHRTGVDLVFENNTNDTVFLFTRFHNHSFGGGGEIPLSSGIVIEFFYNDRPFTFNWGELATRSFIFSNGRTVIHPQSKVKLFFNIGDYFRFPLPEDAKGKYEVSFFMNYIYSKLGSTELPKQVFYFQTNRVTIVEPIEDNENCYRK